MKRSVLACLSIWVGLSSVGCRPEATQAACLPLDPSTSSSAAGVCGPETCVPTTPLLEITNDFAPNGQFHCFGCELSAPSGFQLNALLQEEKPELDYLDQRSAEIRLDLDASWDRSLTASSLNAHLTGGALIFTNLETSTRGTPLKFSSYKLFPGEIAVAYLEDGRLHLELEAHALLARVPALGSADCFPSTYCACTYWDHDVAEDGSTRAFRVDVPYTVVTPPPAP